MLLAELEKYRELLDQSSVRLRSVSFTVKLMKGSGLPRVVLTTTESANDDE
jgi:hypothetical protein